MNGPGIYARWNWSYTESDPAMMLFTAAMHRFQLAIEPQSHVLELGCSETDFLERLRACDPTLDLTGVDARPQGRDHTNRFRILKDNACDPTIVAPASFDWVVLLGALEHFGLGFYGDPIVEDGDTVTMQNVARWLKPGGCVYFDVPCNPRYRVQENRHFRQYAPESIAERLIEPTQFNHQGAGPMGYDKGEPWTWTGWKLREVARAYSLPEPHAGTWCDEPVEELVPYHFVAVVARKVVA